MHLLFSRHAGARISLLGSGIIYHLYQFFGLLGSESNIRILVEPEYLRRVRSRELVYVPQVSLVLVRVGNDILEAAEILNQLKFRLENSLSVVLFSVGVEKLSIQVVSYLPAVLYLTDDVNYHRKSELEVFLHVRKTGESYLLVEVFLDELQRGLQITIVKLVGNAPSELSELPSLLNDRVKETSGEHKSSPVRMVDSLQELRVDHRLVCLQQTRFESFGGLVSYLDCLLQ